MRLIDADELLRRYDEEHEGEPGRARKLILEAPTVWTDFKAEFNHVLKSLACHTDRSAGCSGCKYESIRFFHGECLERLQKDAVEILKTCREKFEVKGYD